ncbi:lipid II:glycine glycyltransferase FemX [Dyella sp.]|uniref:lipid II:glycine glycyltransferase FemX n=1 Tax=Dyella sp. TaxID=1869338 RepID=UPI002D7793C1|nr:GNAT family N-acetyltransferase [Dyella sp.]HET7333273.1 GNAT family N-acetyltransferase [Dyella sp.]
MDEITATNLSKEEYAKFLATVPHSAFHTLEWLTTLQTTYPLQLQFIGYFQKGNLFAVTPLMGLRRGPFTLWGAPIRKCNTPPATIFCSPDSEAPKVLPALCRWIRHKRLSYVQITLASDHDQAEGLADKIEALDNLELDLSRPLKSIWDGLSQQRTSVRKAVKSGVRLHWGYQSKILDAQHKVLQDTYRSQGVQPNIPSQLYSTLLANRRSNEVRVLYATYEGRVIAIVWVICDATRCYYWDAAGLSEARELNANHLLVWCLIRWASKRRLDILDFVGTSVGGRGGSRPGIGRFKQSMGGRPVPYRIAYWYSPLMKVIFACYRHGLQLRRRFNKIRSTKNVRHP